MATSYAVTAGQTSALTGRYGQFTRVLGSLTLKNTVDERPDPMPDPHPLAVAALQARSIAARAPLARAAGVASVPELVTGAPADPWAAGELARVIALQDLRPDDRLEALAILGRLRRAGTIAPEHQ